MDLDAADYLAAIAVPTLVIHASGDRVIPVAAGRYVAAHIPDAQFVEIPGDDHFAEAVPNWQEMADAWLGFVTGVRPSHETDRRVMTIVFTDIVDSALRTASSGDGQWRRMLDSHDQIVWEATDRHRGTIVVTTGELGGAGRAGRGHERHLRHEDGP